MAVPTTAGSRISFTTGAPDFTRGDGVLWTDGTLTYRLVKDSIYTTPITGAIADITYRFGRNSGYLMNSMDVAPTLTSITPATGVAAGGTAFTIVGVNLAGDGTAATTVAIGGVACTSVVVADGGLSLTAVSGAHTAATVNVVVTTTGGATTITNGFIYT